MRSAGSDRGDGHEATPVTASLDDDGMRRILVHAARRNGISVSPNATAGPGRDEIAARYVRGGPIKDYRLVSFDGQQVTFRYGNHRNLNEQGQPQQADLTVTVEEFLRRWSAHCRCRAYIWCGRGVCCQRAAAEAGAGSGATAGAGDGQEDTAAHDRAARLQPPLGTVSGLSARHDRDSGVTAGRCAAAGRILAGGRLRGRVRIPIEQPPLAACPTSHWSGTLRGAITSTGMSFACSWPLYDLALTVMAIFSPSTRYIADTMTGRSVEEQ